MNLDPTASQTRISALFKPLLGLLLLGLVIVWIAKQGILFDKLSVKLILASTTASFFINLLNAAVIQTIVGAYRGNISYLRSLHISTLGTLGNAAGGLPVGTTLKFALLYKQSGLKIREITLGLILFTAAITFMLLGYVSISISAMNFRLSISIIPGILFVLGVTMSAFLWSWLSAKKIMAQSTGPLLRHPYLAQMLVVSFSLTSMFILNYWIIGYFLVPDVPPMQMIFIASVGILAGLGSLLQSVGGISEISMGIATAISGLNLIDGAQLALTMRIASLISSAIILSLLYLLPLHASFQKRPDRPGK